jgi:hypothetical protein
MKIILIRRKDNIRREKIGFGRKHNLGIKEAILIQPPSIPLRQNWKIYILNFKGADKQAQGLKNLQ